VVPGAAHAAGLLEDLEALEARAREADPHTEPAGTRPDDPAAHLPAARAVRPAHRLVSPHAAIVPRPIADCNIALSLREWRFRALAPAENGFCTDGEQEKLVAEGELEIGGRLPVNTDGGRLANGEPIGASGLRRIHEVVLQMRGQAGERQVPGDPKVGYTQLYGAPGVAGVSIHSV
jgi:acetyl-CoA acetyltransferase